MEYIMQDQKVIIQLFNYAIDNHTIKYKWLDQGIKIEALASWLSTNHSKCQVMV